MMKKSLRNLFKKKNREPRQEQELVSEYNKLATRVGLVSNQIKMFESEREGLYKQMGEVNAEAGARLKLDAEAKAKAASNPQPGAQ